MERSQGSQGSSGKGDGSGETSTPSRSPRDFSVPGFSLFSPRSEIILGLRRYNAGDRAGEDQTAAMANPQREEENVPEDQTATTQDQESTERSSQREGSGDAVGSEQNRENADPHDQTATVEGQELAEQSRQAESDNAVAGEMSRVGNALEAILPDEVSSASDDRDIIQIMQNTDARDQVAKNQTTKIEDEQQEENAPGHGGDGRSTMIQGQESMERSPGQRREDDVLALHGTDADLREWPLPGSKRGIQDRSAATQGQGSMQRSHVRKGDDDAVSGSRRTEWPQQFERLAEEGEKKKKAKEQKREQRRRHREGDKPQTP